ncbi:hypothetical protein NL676_004242 [Syzygium grande]|nr:hypothetical protein NL676_004242 [Syzygium grande]
MQTMVNLNSSLGLPLCVSGITRAALSLSQEMVDHDRRRRAMKRMRSRPSQGSGEPAGDLADLLSELAFDSSSSSSSSFGPCTAKAA